MDSCVCFAAGVTVGEPCTLYYDRSRGSLPQNAKPVFKAGLNRWESLQLEEMHRAEGTPAGDSEWWSVDISIPKVKGILSCANYSCACCELPVLT